MGEIRHETCVFFAVSFVCLAWQLRRWASLLGRPQTRTVVPSILRRAELSSHGRHTSTLGRGPTTVYSLPRSSRWAVRFRAILRDWRMSLRRMRQAPPALSRYYPSLHFSPPTDIRPQEYVIPPVTRTPLHDPFFEERVSSPYDDVPTSIGGGERGNAAPVYATAQRWIHHDDEQLFGQDLQDEQDVIARAKSLIASPLKVQRT